MQNPPQTVGYFHTLAWNRTAAGAETNIDSAPVTDDIFQIQNAHFFMPDDLQIVKIFASGLTLTRARLRSAKLQQTNPNYIRPINQALLPANNANVDWFYDNPISLPQADELILEGTVSGAGENFFVGFLRKNYQPIPAGDRYTIRRTGTTAAVDAAWTTLTQTVETNLPVGQYAIIGAEVQSTNIIGFRYIVDNQWYRPGNIGISSVANRNNWQDYAGRMGVWGVFNTLSYPRLQVLCDGADASFEEYIRVVRVGS